MPDSFIIKATHGSGWNIIVEDKNTDFKYIIKNVIFLSMNYYYLGREYQYKNIEPQIMIENLLKDENGDIPSDYKFFHLIVKSSSFKLIMIELMIISVTFMI